MLFCAAWTGALRRRSNHGAAKKEVTAQAALPARRPDAAGIDVGATEVYAAVPADRDLERPVRCFPAFTEDLHALADWLEHCGIETVEDSMVRVSCGLGLSTQLMG